MKQVGRELGVCYVLEGSVRNTQNRLRISAQLIDAGSGAHLWADRFEGSLEDVFQLQDNVALSVAGVIEPALQAAETACGHPPSDRPHRLRPLPTRLRYAPISRSTIWRGAVSCRAGDRARSPLRARSSPRRGLPRKPL